MRLRFERYFFEFNGFSVWYNFNVLLFCEKPVSRTTFPNFLTTIFKQSCIKSLFDIIVDITS